MNEWSNISSVECPHCHWGFAPSAIEQHLREKHNEVKSLNPLDDMTENQLLVKWQACKDAVEQAKAAEMEMRKYIVSRAFPARTKGVNNKELGNGYVLKAGVKFNYNLDNDNKKVIAALDKIATIGNNGTFIAERLVSWKPSFLLTEYRVLIDEAKEGSIEAKQIIETLHTVLTINDAAPTLEIKPPKVKK